MLEIVEDVEELKPEEKATYFLLYSDQRASDEGYLTARETLPLLHKGS